MFFVRSSAILKSFLNRRDLHFIYILKWFQKFQSYFFSLSITTVHKFHFLLMDSFFNYLSFFQDFLQNQTHTVKISFWFLEKQGPTIDSMYGLLLLPRAPLDSIDTTVLSVSFLFCNIRTTKISHNKIDISLSPINKTFTFLTPHCNYTYPLCKWKIYVTIKKFICFEQDCK